MLIDGERYQTIWLEGKTVKIIDQRQLPHEFTVEELRNINDVATAIQDMHVRGAGLIGVTAGYGMHLAAQDAPAYGFLEHMEKAGEKLKETRPTAINLEWAVNRVIAATEKGDGLQEKKELAKKEAQAIEQEEKDFCKHIGLHGKKVLEEMAGKGQKVNVLTHCNAGWLAFVDWGSATSPIYQAYDSGIDVHVFVSMTGPRNQGALTAWELGKHGVPYTVIADNTSAYLLLKGDVDVVITGADRVTRNGDVINKIGTVQKALAAQEAGVPFYVALPSSTFDWKLTDGKKVPIEKRSEDEVKYARGLGMGGKLEQVLLTPGESPALNYGFDVTPAKLVTGLITERGVCEASEEGIKKLYPEHYTSDE